MRQDVIDQLVREGLADRLWAKVCERAGYKCEYCDKDMLASLEDYLSWQADHIIPWRANGEHTFDNIALSCPTCNMRLKRGWNPVDAAGENACRRELVRVVREHVEVKRSQLNYEENFSRHREIVGYPSSHQQCNCCE